MIDKNLLKAFEDKHAYEIIISTDLITKDELNYLVEYAKKHGFILREVKGDSMIFSREK